jgi:hypothetical protein
VRQDINGQRRWDGGSIQPEIKTFSDHVLVSWPIASDDLVDSLWTDIVLQDAIRVLTRLRRLAGGRALLAGPLVNKRLNLRACIVGKSLETAVVKTYPLLRSGFLRQHSPIMQPSPNVAASNTPPNALVVKTFWSKLLIYHERHTENGPNRRRRAKARC